VRFGSVRARLTLGNVGVLALVLLILGASLRYSAEANLTAAVDRLLIGRAHRMTEGLGRRRQRGAFAPRFMRPGPMEEFPLYPTRPGPMGWGPGEGPPPARLGRPSSARVLDPQRRSLISGIFEPPWDPDAFTRSIRGEESFSTVSLEGVPIRVFSAPLWREGQVAGVVQIAYPLTEVLLELNRLTGRLMTLMPFALLAAGLAGAFLTERALRPVRRITHAAGRIEASDLSGRLPVIGRDEFSELAATFNGMLGRLEDAFTRLEQAFEQQRRFTADASHELRTPLTVIKANSSLALRGKRSATEYQQALQAVDRAADLTTRIVQDLLLLARADAGQLGIERAPARLLDLLECAVEAVRHPASAPVAVEVADASLAVSGSVHHLVRLFTNLLENALRHTPPQGSVTVAARSDGEVVVVIVADTGSGIPPEHLPHVCERFYRVDAARTRQDGGTGLGLAICQSIVEAHGGVLTLDSALNVGTTVAVRLPRAVSPEPETGEVSQCLDPRVTMHSEEKESAAIAD
jgi:two-component system OmpR family sensor kinase